MPLIDNMLDQRNMSMGTGTDKIPLDYTAMDYRSMCAFLIGNEAEGLTEELASVSDQRIRIPMGGQVESLNASLAATVLLYEADRQRRAGSEKVL